LTWQIPDSAGTREAAVSIWSVHGRLRNVRVIAAPRDLVLLRNSQIGETDLIHRDAKWFLYASVEAPEALLAEPANGFVGVDMGIINIATTSDGEKASGIRLNRYRKRQAILRQRLQAKKTSSARRLLRKRRRKEARFAADVNHQISKRIVAVADLQRLRLGRQEKPPLPSGIRVWSVSLRWARRPQRSDQHRFARCRTLGRSHASTRSAYPDGQLGRQQHAYRHPLRK